MFAQHIKRVHYGLLVMLIAGVMVVSAQEADTPTPTPEPTPDMSGESVEPAVGYWGGQAHFGAEDFIPGVVFEVQEDGTLVGQLTFHPLDIDEEAAELVEKNGCVVTFDTSDTDEELPVYVHFVEGELGYLTYWADSCTIKFFGDLEFEEVSGLWEVQRQPELAPVAEEATPIEVGIGIYDTICSSCHGAYGDGNSDVPPLNGDDIAVMTDDEIMHIIINGVPNTEMGPWAAGMTDEQRAGIIAILRNMDALQN